MARQDYDIHTNIELPTISKTNKRKVNKQVLSGMKHECKLPLEEDILVQYIDSGYFVDARRKFRSWLMVSELNPRSKIYLKSSFAIRREKERHLQEFYFMIHPFSQMRYYWELFMVIILLVILVMIPIQMCYQSHAAAINARLVFDLICVVDILVTFNTGYQNMNTKKIIMARSQVAIHYLSTWFFLDLITCINLEVIGFYGNMSWLSSIYVKVPTALKILRIVTLLKYMNRYRDYKQFSIYKFKTVQMVFVFFLLVLWMTAILYINRQTFDQMKLPKDRENKTLLQCFHQITNLFFLMSNSKSTTNFMMVLDMIVLTFGIILQLFFFAQLLQMVSKINSSKNKYHEMLQQLHDYMLTKDLPNQTIKRVINYFVFRFQKNYFKEEEILGTLSKKLIEEISLYSCEGLINNVNIFKNMPTSVILKMSNAMKQEIFLPNDVIVQSGTIGDCMYFISSGTVAIYTPSGKEVRHLSDGSNFGEVCLIMEHASRVATVVAVDYCDLFCLTRNDFRVAIEPYPELYQRTVKIARQRMKEVMLTEHYRYRPEEYFDFTTVEGIADFKAKLYEM